ncbi:hypothetical protein BHE90_017207 [Fusarium euwallaceae]|uniref:Uncharacterized protein n=1 Tax=Fusarium euwallaceae TaxID=1147111 RepID=A0A430KY38_9HYPO|nr:hypothetical protein BHE90_017207 [Fusarium euwallaceae]
MSSPLFTQSFLDEDELKLRSRDRSATEERRRHKEKIRRRRESFSEGVTGPGSASSATAPRSSIEAATPTEPGPEPATPTRVVPCTPSFSARFEGNGWHEKRRKVNKSPVTIAVTITTPSEHAADTSTARSNSSLHINIQLGLTSEVRLEGSGWAVTGINVVGETGY